MVYVQCSDNKERLYFDYNAATPLAPFSRELIDDLLTEGLYNPSSTHFHGRKTLFKLDQARIAIASYFECLPKELIFLSGATEANQLCFYSVCSQLDRFKHPRPKALISAVEHDAVKKPLQHYSKIFNFDLVEIPLDSSGELNQAFFSKQFDDNVFLVSIMLANNETGFIFDHNFISRLVKDTAAYYHIDAACAVGKLPIDFKKLQADFLSFSGQKFYAPSGSGGLIVRDKAPLNPLILGGLQERSRRAGTHNTLGILLMKHGLDFIYQDFEKKDEFQNRLRLKLKQGLKTITDEVEFFERKNHQLSQTLSMRFEGVDGQTLLARLDLEGVSASFGSACHSGSLEVSPIILNSGVALKKAKEVIRLSFGALTTEEDIDQLLSIFKKILPSLINLKSFPS